MFTKKLINKKQFPKLLTNRNVFLAFIFIGLLIYGKSLFNGFVWDDIVAITENDQISKYTVSNILGPNIYNDGAFYRPLSAFYFFTLHFLFNNNAFFYHLVQLSLHIIVTTLLFKVFKNFLTPSIAFFTSLIFLIHPINTEPISFISGGQAILYSVFGLSAFYITLQKKLDFKNSLLVVLFMAFSILAKEEGLQYIIIINIFCLLFQKRTFRKIFLLSFLSGVFYLAVRLIFAHDNFSFNNNLLNQLTGSVGAHPITVVTLSASQKLLNIPVVIYYYLKTFLLPLKLSVDQIWAVTSFDLSVFILPLLLIAPFFTGLILFGLTLYRNNLKTFKIYLFFLIWFLIGITIHLPILQPFNMTVADRWFYFPEIGLLGLIATFLQTKIKSVSSKLIIVIYLIIIILLSTRSFVRSLNFHDNITLFEHDSRVYNNSLIEQNLGYFYLGEGNLKAAIDHSYKSVKFFPTENNLLNLALVLEIDNQLNEAEYYYQKTLASTSYYFAANGHSEDVYFFCSRFFLRINKPIKALEILKDGIKFYPQSDRLFIVSGISKYQMGNKKDSLVDISQAIKISPEAEGYKNIYKAIENNEVLKNPI